MADISIQTYTFGLHYLCQLSNTAKAATLIMPEQRKLAELFLPASADADDDGSNWFTPPSGVEVEEVKVASGDNPHDFAEVNLGHGIVVIEVRLHSYSKWPANDLATAIKERIRLAAASFSPALALVTYDDNWDRRAASLEADKLPAVLVALANVA